MIFSHDRQVNFSCTVWITSRAAARPRGSDESLLAQGLLILDPAVGGCAERPNWGIGPVWEQI